MQKVKTRIETLINELLAEVRRLDHEAVNPFFQLGYLKALISELLSNNRPAEAYLEQRIEYLKQLKRPVTP